MTLALYRMHQALPRAEKSPLPPAILTDDVLKSVGVSRQFSPDTREALTLASHFAFGAVSGAIYSLLSPKVKAPALVKGMLFGVGVWSGSYFGWIPALGFRASGFKMTPRRNLMMFAAHLVWGASLALSENEMRKRPRQLFDGKGGRA